MPFSARPASSQLLTHLLLALGLLAILTPFPTLALNDLYWDTNGTADGTGAITGTWGTSNFWNADPNGITDTFQISTTATNDLHFSAGINGGSGTITVSGSQLANGLYFEEGAISLSGGTSITLSDGGIINNTADTSVIPTISTALVTSGTVTVTGRRIWFNNPSFAGGGTLVINTSNATLLENSGALNGLSTINLLNSGLDIRQNISGTNYDYAAGTTLNFVNSTSLNTNLAQTVNWLGNLVVASGKTGTLSAFNSASSFTIAGHISGAGGISITGSGILQFSGINTYAGATTVSSGTLKLVSGRALADSGLVSMGTGTSANVLDIQASETIGALAGGTATYSVVNLASGQTLTLTSGTQTYSGTFTGNGTLTVSGATQTLATGVSLNQVNVNAGTLILSAANTLTQGLTLNGGTLRLLNAGAPGSSAISASGGTLQAGVAQGSSLTIGNAINVTAGTRVVLSAQTNGGSSGTALITFGGPLSVSSGGLLQLGTPATNAAYGTANGAVVFGAGAVSGTKLQINGNNFTTQGLATNETAPGRAVVENGAATAATLTVALSAGSSNTYAGTLRNGGNGTLGLSVNGGTGASLTLAGANTFSGNTNVTGGSLVLAHALALQNSTVTSGGTGLTFAASVSSLRFTLGGLSGSTNLSLENTSSQAVTLSLGANGSTQTYSGVLSGAGGLTKVGAGQFSLSGANTYTGATTVNSGELRTDFSLAGAPLSNIISSSSRLVLGGGMYTERQLVNTNANAQTFNGLTVKAGSSVVNQIRAGSGTLLLTLGTVTRETGGTVALSANGGGPSGLAATGTNTASGIMGGWATYLTTNGGATTSNATDWATYNGGKIVALAAGSYTNTASTTAATNLDLTANVTLSSNATVGSVRFNNATTTPTLTLNGTHTVDSGGILVTPNVSTNATLITGGTLTSGNGQDLVIIQNNTSTGGSLTVEAVISGAIGLTKSGAGQLVLTAANTYTGDTYLNGGTTSISSNANLGNVATGGDVYLNGGTLSVTTTLTMDNAGSAKRDIILEANGGTLDVASSQTLTLSGTLSGEGALTKSGAGNLVLTGTSSQTGTTTVSAGNLQVGQAGVGQTGSGAIDLNGAGAVISGTGTVQGTTTVTTGTLRPGDAGGSSIGTFTVTDLIFTPASGTTVAEFQITGSAGAGTLASDKLNVTGSLTLNGSSNFVVDGTGYTPTLGDSFTLLDWATVLDTGLTSTFNTGSSNRTGANSAGNEGNLDLPDLSSYGLTWDILNFAGSGSLTIVVTPEPSRVLLLLGGCCGLLLRRRRQP